MLKDTFCSSPWFHLVVDAQGQMHFCRWGSRDDPHANPLANLRMMSMRDFMRSKYMCNIRSDLLAGKKLDICMSCYKQDEAGKVNGRLKQLIKSGILPQHFEKSLASSQHYPIFLHSLVNEGETYADIADLQIDLGNICNSACIYCHPRASTKVYSDHKILKWLPPDTPPVTAFNWTADKELLDKFIAELLTLNELRYIHFIGGETLFMDSFYTICNAMIESGMSKRVVMGFTTNGTIFDAKIANMLSQFKNVHLGVSMDCPTPLNDYVRWPSKIDTVLENINKFRTISSNVQIQIRPTPTMLSIYHYPELMDWLLVNNLHSEVCHFLNNPKWLQIRMLPLDIRDDIIERMRYVIAKYDLEEEKGDLVINTRLPKYQRKVVLDDALGYINYLMSEPEASVVERAMMVQNLMSLEALHKNCIIDYLPEYELFLRRHDYKSPERK